MRLKARAEALWEGVWSSYWFLPGLMALGALGLSLLLTRLDLALARRDVGLVGWPRVTSAQGARALLTASATAMASIAGVVFSVTIVTMSLASNQLGPRLLRTFMRNKGNQVVLGSFVAVALYCLMTLQQVRGGDDPDQKMFVPQLSMLAAMIFTLCGLGVLIYFINHSAQMIQAPNVIAAVSRDLRGAIEESYPEPLEGRPGRDSHEAGSDSRDALEGQARDLDPLKSAEVRAGTAGYLQRIELDQIMENAAKRGLVVKLERRPGQYVDAADAVLRVWPAEAVDARLRKDFSQTFTVGVQRSLAQDPEYALDQLVEIALRALSPSLNDPFTAMHCVDRIGEALSFWAGRRMPSPFLVDDRGRLRVIGYPPGFCKAADQAFNQVRQNSVRSLAVMLRLLEALARVAGHALRQEDRDCLDRQARAVYEQARAEARAEMDRAAVEERYTAFREAATREPGGPPGRG